MSSAPLSEPFSRSRRGGGAFVSGACASAFVCSMPRVSFPQEEKKTLKERLQAIQEVTQTVQNVLGYIASLGERIAK